AGVAVVVGAAAAVTRVAARVAVRSAARVAVRTARVGVAVGAARRRAGVGGAAGAALAARAAAAAAAFGLAARGGRGRLRFLVRRSLGGGLLGGRRFLSRWFLGRWLLLRRCLLGSGGFLGRGFLGLRRRGGLAGRARFLGGVRLVCPAGRAVGLVAAPRRAVGLVVAPGVHLALGLAGARLVVGVVRRVGGRRVRVPRVRVGPGLAAGLGVLAAGAGRRAGLVAGGGAVGTARLGCAGLGTARLGAGRLGSAAVGPGGLGPGGLRAGIGGDGRGWSLLAGLARGALTGRERGRGEGALVGRAVAARPVGLVRLDVDGVVRAELGGELLLLAGEVVAALRGPDDGQVGRGGLDQAGGLVGAALAQRGPRLLEVLVDGDRGLDRPRPLRVEDLGDRPEDAPRLGFGRADRDPGAGEGDEGGRDAEPVRVRGGGSAVAAPPHRGDDAGGVAG